MEEVLLLCGYELLYKDADVCSMIPKDRTSKLRPINIPQKPGPLGISVEIIEHMLFEARVDSFQYLNFLAKVQARQQAQKDAQTRG